MEEGIRESGNRFVEFIGGIDAKYRLFRNHRMACKNHGSLTSYVNNPKIEKEVLEDVLLWAQLNKASTVDIFITGCRYMEDLKYKQKQKYVEELNEELKKIQDGK